MTWRERRIVTILSTILLILMAALLVVLGMRYRASRDIGKEDPAPGETGVAADQNAYTSLQYDNGSTTLSFTRDDNGTWTWDGSRDFPLDDTVITSILELLTNWKPQQTLTGAEAVEKSGLSEPVASLTAATASGAVTTVLFGNTTTDGNSYYVRLNGDETTVYILADTLYQLMKVPVYDMYDLPELPELTEDRILSVTVQGASPDGDQPGPLTVLTAQRAEDDTVTTWRSSGANVTDMPLVQSLLEDVTALTITRCVDFDPSDEAATFCGFDAPAAKLDIAYTTEGGAQQALRITVGERLPDGSGRYIRLGDDTTLFFLSTELLDPLMRIAAEGLEG
ncbi:DUF4340 domain-containing protein [Oscillibacter valericigenes]|uniref:DUF4340 domain-containing protein n=1 Tax=Oscillibacter valericigenes TaxID=351091 RepID=UPI001F26DC10|nr:DUF4340 domain-containing protein [Oscillibacter valericigenes]MCF2663743.1 DUF4340 domain-containing protein [Oscillibacter valericigenes]